MNSHRNHLRTLVRSHLSQAKNHISPKLKIFQQLHVALKTKSQLLTMVTKPACADASSQHLTPSLPTLSLSSGQSNPLPKYTSPFTPLDLCLFSWPRILFPWRLLVILQFRWGPQRSLPRVPYLRAPSQPSSSPPCLFPAHHSSLIVITPVYLFVCL